MTILTGTMKVTLLMGTIKVTLLTGTLRVTLLTGTMKQCLTHATTRHALAARVKQKVPVEASGIAAEPQAFTAMQKACGNLAALTRKKRKQFLGHATVRHAEAGLVMQKVPVEASGIPAEPQAPTAMQKACGNLAVRKKYPTRKTTKKFLSHATPRHAMAGRVMYQIPVEANGIAAEPQAYSAMQTACGNLAALTTMKKQQFLGHATVRHAQAGRVMQKVPVEASGVIVDSQAHTAIQTASGNLAALPRKTRQQCLTTKLRKKSGKCRKGKKRDLRAKKPEKSEKRLKPPKKPKEKSKNKPEKSLKPEKKLKEKLKDKLSSNPTDQPEEKNEEPNEPEGEKRARHKPESGTFTYLADEGEAI